ncbi:hypothetical protein [Pantoea sp. 1.19]|uniref:hypothetical protein n=1 Tax=Pantoea sp. 1.19 TaxID=1925589 RepID=UPI0009F8FE01|nr:hypothetical protein [Pantoea sp. 1.19]
MELRLPGLLLTFSLLLTSGTCNALFIENLNIDLLPKKGVKFVSIANRTTGAKAYTVNVVQISTPRAEGTETVINDGSLLYSPQKLILKSEQRSGFKFYYNGKNDNKERYFRITFIETPLQTDKVTLSHKELYYDYRIIVKAIMIVRPKSERFAYRYQNRTITNTGNTYFKYMSSKHCQSGYSHSTFLPPGASLSLSDEETKENRVIIYKNSILTLSTCLAKS